MNPQDAWGWYRARRFLPFDLDDPARSTDLLRLCAVPGRPCAVSAWGRESGLSRMGAYALALRYVSVLDGRETPMAQLGRATVA